ncbi:MAG: UDP-N-acetylglucosamine 1-carboxyvinyltransferase, partial [Patescibacteria group bacterium]|nr:UDP-N-acetylglucosamine 1-carboxyvinyltransferase [Patescibacteria group bacterium]
YFFSTISVTGTQSLLMTACLAKGKTILRNCAMEPEIKALADYLNSQGAKIDGAGTPTISITGVSQLRAGHCQIIPDRIETGSFALMAAATKSNLKITNCNPNHVLNLLTIFKKIGIDFAQGQDWLEIKESGKIKAYNIKTHEYPGFPTDLQSPYLVLMTQAEGNCLIQETIYDRRLIWTDMLSQMGANIITCDPHRVVINGPSKLYGKKLISPDIRAGIALVIAALIAEGTTEIDNIYQIDRGYEKLDERLRSIGALIERKEESYA